VTQLIFPQSIVTRKAAESRDFAGSAYRIPRDLKSHDYVTQTYVTQKCNFSK